MFQFLQDITTSFLLQLYQITGNLGLAIIILTLLIRFVLAPLSFGTMRSQKKLQEIKPELDQLKKKHGKDKVALQKAQMELYKKYNINPHFLWLDLRQADAYHVLPILAAVTQFVLSLMIAPGAEHRDIVPNNSSNKEVQEANKQEEDMSEMAQTMQKQMIFMMPIMTGFIAWRFQSGLALYWVATTVFSIGQQYFVSGWGGIHSYWLQFRTFTQRFLSVQKK